MSGARSQCSSEVYFFRPALFVRLRDAAVARVVDERFRDEAVDLRPPLVRLAAVLRLPDAPAVRLRLADFRFVARLRSVASGRLRPGVDSRASPVAARCLLTVRAAISSATSLLRPASSSDCLMC